MKPRQVAVVIAVVTGDIPGLDKVERSPAAVNSDEVLFLLCSSRKHKRKYVLPKGGIEKGETAAIAALREGWEEAGFHGTTITTLGDAVEDARSHKSATYAFSLATVTAILEDWPERSERTRLLVTRSELSDLLSWRPEFLEGLQRIPQTSEELRNLCAGNTA